MSENFYIKNIKPLQIINGAHTSDITCIEFWGDTLLFTGSSDKTIKVWRSINDSDFIEETFSPLLGHKYGVTSLKISPQGGVLASSSVDGTICLWDIKNGSILNVLKQRGGESIRACAFSPDEIYIISSDDKGCLCAWDQNKTFIKSFRCDEESVHALAFSSDSKLILIGSNLGNMQFFLTSNFIENECPTVNCKIDAAHDLGVLGVDFNRLVQTDPSNCNTTIYTVVSCGTDHLIKIWKIFRTDNLENGTNNNLPLVAHTLHDLSTIHSSANLNAKCIKKIRAHGSSVTAVRFNFQGTLIVSCSMDKTIKLWNLKGVCIKTLAEHTRYVNCIAINLNSKLIASGSNDKSIIIWDLIKYYNMDLQLPFLFN